MGLLRGGAPCARAMARLGAVRSHHCALLLAAALAVCAFYYLGSGRETFSSATKRLKEARAGAPAAAPSPPGPVPEQARGSAAPALGAKAKSLDGGGGAGPVDYHLLMMFTKAEHNAALQAKARVALRSLLRLAKFEAHEVLNLHFVSEEASREVAKALLRELLPPAAGFKCKVVFHDVAVLTDKLFPIVEAMQKHFSAGSGTYYSDSIFFLSVAMHQIMPKALSPFQAAPPRPCLQRGRCTLALLWSALAFLSVACWKGHVWPAGPAAHTCPSLCPSQTRSHSRLLTHTHRLLSPPAAGVSLSPLEASYAMEKKTFLPNWSRSE
ncbi:xyloside xylosyltransferase 1 isoform X2 [Pipistrellus kuhlii]|uniref:xyloside xylosyltransferase 1 isoform X2 n=1 Tax=Pipistrellus kuhlii TaxID=59472 RepID=UPI00174ED247|nr:xyloside xylosyltransferase 1 isoform X2 [Pipistrellus kuhlii]